MIKKVLVIFLFFYLAFASTAVVAQNVDDYEISDFESGDVFGFGCPLMEFSQIDKRLGISIGGDAYLMVKKRFYVGGYGLGLATKMQYDYTDSISYQDLKLSFGHAGLMVGYINKPTKSIHWSVSARAGMGSIGLIDKIYGVNYFRVIKDQVYVFTPQLEIEFLISPWIKFNMGVGYRIVTGVNNPAFSSSDFNSPVFSMSMLFGKFADEVE
ncbi:MAG: hypothetical protein V2A54_04720 [Bacteroidota bacterium]